MKSLKPLVHTWTVGQLIDELQSHDPSATVSIGGCLRISRVKQRSPTHVDIEAAEATSRDPFTGEVTVQVLD
jgi:hypothetical protein